MAYSENIIQSRLKNSAIFKNPFVIFLPFLLFYSAYVLIFYNKTLWGDEVRHIQFASNLLHGFYSSPPPKISFDVGPGYPLYLVFFVALHLPLFCACLMNAVFNYLAVVFLFKALREMVPFKIALIFCIFLGCYYNSLEYMALMYSESISLFLISLIIFLLTKAFNTSKPKDIKKYSLLAGFFIGYLVLTKIIFGYVLVAMLIGAILLWLTKMKSVNYRKYCLIFFIALATTSPYLIYTYHLTGKLFYWGTSGGINLYWMSSPFEGEYGSWAYNPKYNSTILPKFPRDATGGQLSARNKDNFMPGGEDSIIIHHQKDFEELKKYDGVEEDDAYKKIVIENIKSHPLKYIENCISNMGRIIFNYPYSYTIQKPGTLVRLPMNGVIVILLLFSLIPAFINWRRLAFHARLILFIVVFYLGGTVLGCAETRMFTPIVPMILFWIAYIMNKSIKVNLKFN
jgi:Dolichyl-phosphate-mannose-protein mannosyltransferase